MQTAVNGNVWMTRLRTKQSFEHLQKLESTFPHAF